MKFLFALGLGTRRNVPVVLLTLLSATFSAGLSARAVEIVYDSFDYDVGLIQNKSGGNGWATSWADDGLVETVDNPLAYTDSKGNALVTSGKAAQLTEWNGTWRQWDLSGVDASLLDSSRDNMFGADGATLWVSFLGLGTEIGRSADVQLAASADGIAFEKRWGLGRPYKILLDGTQGGNNDTWGIMDYRLNTGEADTFHSAGVSYDEQVFYVARIDFLAGDDEISVWIDPDLDQEPAFADSVVNKFVVEDSAVNATIFSGPADTYFDELRVGTTWADISPIAGSSGAPGDFDADGDVDGADFLAWQTGAATPADLTLWENNFGTSAAGASTGAVPEPTSICLLSIAGVMGCLRRRR